MKPKQIFHAVPLQQAADRQDKHAAILGPKYDRFATIHAAVVGPKYDLALRHAAVLGPKYNLALRSLDVKRLR